MKTIRIALAQINTTVGDLKGNSQKILDYTANAARMSANVVVFPELALTGYPPEDLLLKKHFVDDNLCALKAITPAIKNIVAVIGFVDRDNQGLIYNAAAVISNGKLKGVYRKNNLPNYGVFDEKRYFAKGDGIKIFNYDGLTFAVNICEDIWTKAGAQILLNLSASPYHAGKTKEREKILVACAKKNRVFVAYCNLIGGQDELVFDGSSVIFSPQGKAIACGKAFEEDLIVADIQVPATRISSKAIVVGAWPLAQGKVFITGKKERKLSSHEEIYKALVLGTRDYIRKNGFQKAVIGISGGIDSALVAAVTRDAIGKENVLAVSMPSPYTSKGTRADARLVAKNLGIHFQEIPIKKVFGAYLETLKPVFKGLKPNIAEENIQARIRGNILMALSNKFGHLVLTTGNKSEIAVGYCTLYGDMAGGFAVIKDVPKTTVYQLAHFVNQKAGWPIIPQSIIARAPTAELKKNQKDQDTLPPYDVLDKILKAYVEEDKELSRLPQGKSGAHVIKKITSLIDRMEYKRRQAPLGVKITPKAFGKDRRLPITNQYKPR
ncbi:MAG: NAD+ synthase [Candidatus Omnitrophica bacterium]|nr:NAD+ synthase [Candidatus Omnitrophota bacterium]